MIQLSARGQAAYQLLTLIVALLPLYAVGFLASALLQLPSSPLADLVDLADIEGVKGLVLELAIMSALVCAGLLLAGERLRPRAAWWLPRLWTGLALVSLLLIPVELDWVAELAAALFLLLLALATHGSGESSAIVRVWQIGLLLIAASAFAAHLLEDVRALEALQAFRLHATHPVAAVSLLFWLLRRCSRVEARWAEDGVRIVALLVFLAGASISLGRVGLPAIVSLGATPLIALAYVILAAHCCRALSQRNENASLAPHWMAVAALFWLAGGGFLGALGIQPAISEAISGSHLERAQDWLAGWAPLAIALAVVNESASSLRGGNQRVTGYAPLWLMAFGVGLAGIVQVCRGVAQIYLRDVAAVESGALPALLLPLTVIWMICLVAVAAGLGIYALGFWLRRPRIRVVDA